MKGIVLVLFGALCFYQADAICLNEFDEVETKCAAPFNYNLKQMHEAYEKGVYPEGNKEHFIQFVGCTFRGWGLQNEIGDFDFDKIKTASRFEWKFGKICGDVFSDPNFNPKHGAIKYCSEHLPRERLSADEAAEKLRSCLMTKYYEVRNAHDPRYNDNIH